MEPVTFATEDGVRLEGELRRPDGAPRGTAVVCHAHPRFGGSKDHPILWAVRNELAGKRSVAALLFNFRGIMGSGGSYGGGHDEVRDVRAAIDRVRDEAAGRPTIVCGWSFGAGVALREALVDERVAALALIGLPLTPNDVSRIVRTPRPAPDWRGRRVLSARRPAIVRGRARRGARADPGRDGPLPVAPGTGGRGPRR